jgi:hypothetical protein
MLTFYFTDKYFHLANSPDQFFSQANFNLERILVYDTVFTAKTKNMQTYNNFQEMYNANAVNEATMNAQFSDLPRASQNGATLNARYQETRTLSAYEKEAVGALKQKLDGKEAEYYQQSDNRAVEIANLSKRLNELKTEERTASNQFLKETKDDLEQLKRYGVQTTFVPPQVE